MKNSRYLSVFIILLALITACERQPSSAAGQYRCSPCGNSCDQQTFNKPGTCPHCGMPLIPGDSIKNIAQKNVAILIFDGVEMLDFGGPLEVFASTGAFHVYTVAATINPVMCQGVVKIVPEYTLDNCPQPDIIVIPGGNMTAPLENTKVIDWVKNNEPHAEIVLSVCTGAFVLEKAGLLNGKKATTFHNALADLRKVATTTEVLDSTRWVDNGKIITTAGVSAGIDGSLRVIERLLGHEKALSAAKYMEYDKWKPEEGLIVPPETAIKQ
jgi:transcriptional regulator GlxA family with amidase domain/DNA-directed RNA polymerase subunit RPC12/RpoP